MFIMFTEIILPHTRYPKWMFGAQRKRNPKSLIVAKQVYVSVSYLSRLTSIHSRPYSFALVLLAFFQFLELSKLSQRAVVHGVFSLPGMLIPSVFSWLVRPYPSNLFKQSFLNTM